MPTSRRCRTTLRLTLPAALAVLLDAEAARTGTPVATVAGALLAEGPRALSGAAPAAPARRPRRSEAPGGGATTTLKRGACLTRTTLVGLKPGVAGRVRRPVTDLLSDQVLLQGALRWQRISRERRNTQAVRRRGGAGAVHRASWTTGRPTHDRSRCDLTDQGLSVQLSRGGST